MRYFIGYLISGEAAEWHNKLTDTISAKFGTPKLSGRISPHITISRPFHSSNISKVKTFLTDWTKDRSIPGNIILSGFGHFSDQVVFAETKLDPSILELVTKLRTQINEVNEISKEDFPFYPHATLAYQIMPSEINAIWEYIQSVEKTDFVLPFDNVTIFRSAGNMRWEIEETFILKK